MELRLEADWGDYRPTFIINRRGYVYRGLRYFINNYRYDNGYLILDIDILEIVNEHDWVNIPFIARNILMSPYNEAHCYFINGINFKRD